MKQLKSEIEQVKNCALKELKDASTLEVLEQVRITYLGRNGTIHELMESFKKISPEEKKEVGPLINALKQDTNEAYLIRKAQLANADIEQKLAQDKDFDVTAYLPHQLTGSLHPLTQLLEQIEDIFISMGYQIAYGPEVETEKYNFEALNIPADHPARDMWDTFYLDVPGLLLRTHTSSVQAHVLETKKPPFAVVAPGRCFRHEATDASHDFMFNQLEGVLIGENISVGNLLATIKTFLRALFAQEHLEIRVRPSYFPFVEPGLEIDITCPFCTQGCSVCKKTRWIEMGGAGLVHPNVLEFCGIDTKKYSGFAFGMGLTRLAMLKYGINDIRLMHSGKVAFLEQF